MLLWLRQRPDHVVNGVVVAVGVALVHLVGELLTSASLAQAVSMGAVLASFPHLTGRPLPTFRRTLLGGTLATLAWFVILALAHHPVWRGVAIAALTFLALFGMGWGPRVGPISFSVLIAMIFSLALPVAGPSLPVAVATWSGVLLYALWAWLSAKALEARYRVLAVATVLDAAGALLRARSRVLFAVRELSSDASSPQWGQVHEEGRLAEVLQAASDLLFPVAKRAEVAQLSAVLSRVTEIREIVLTSRLDLELLGEDSAGRFVRARLALALKKLAQALELLAQVLRESRQQQLSGLAGFDDLPDLMEATTLLQGDRRARLLPVVSARLGYLVDEIEAIRALLQGEAVRASMNPQQLGELVVDDDHFQLQSLTAHLKLSSPVLRHAVRSALALSTAYFGAYALPWTTRPYWILLSVAVVLRGTLENTLARRNARVLGTAIGCVIVAVVVPLVSDAFLRLGFFAAVGTAHAFVNVHYLLTAASATVMALLQARLAAPVTSFAVIERLLDTVMGAVLAWAFSYVLPSWERRTLPAAIRRALLALKSYSDAMLEAGETSRPHARVLRQQAYDALESVAAAVRRSAAEPKRVRPPVAELVTALDHGQRLMAHLAAVRSLMFHRGARLSEEQTSAALVSTRRSVDQQLVTETPGQRYIPAPLDFDLPSVPATIEPHPWLLRRLEACARDAAAAGESARAALRALA